MTRTRLTTLLLTLALTLASAPAVLADSHEGESFDPAAVEDLRRFTDDARIVTIEDFVVIGAGEVEAAIIVPDGFTAATAYTAALATENSSSSSSATSCGSAGDASQHAGTDESPIWDRLDHDRFKRAGIGIAHATRPRVTLQLPEGTGMPGRKPHRVPAPAAVNGCYHRCAGGQSPGDLPDDRDGDVGHIRQCDHPARHRGRRGHAAGKAAAHAPACLGIDHDVERLAAQQSGHLAIGRVDHGNTARYGRPRRRCGSS